MLFDDADKVFLQRLGRLFVAPRAPPVAFVGAGASTAVGYPTWRMLLEQLHQLAFGKLKMTSGNLSAYVSSLRKYQDVAWRAQEYRDAIANEKLYLKFLRKQFPRGSKKNRLLHALVQLPIRHYLTTNYDQELERAYQEVHGNSLRVVDWFDPQRAAEWISHWGDHDEPPTCVYLHGRMDEPSSMVLTEKDYQQAYFQANGNAQRLAAVLLLQPVLFLGFSLTDPDLMALLRQANALCLEGARHYALIGLGKRSEIASRYAERARLRRKFGVNAIFFRPGDKYENLEKIVSYLVEAAKQVSAPAKVESPPERVTEQYCWSRDPINPSDPLKGRFGGRAETHQWQSRVRIKRDIEMPRWFHVNVQISARPGSRARLSGRVDFFVHPTFPQYRYWAFESKGVAQYTFYCLGSFTLGVQIHKDKSFLEIDLAEIDGAPLDFQFN